MILCRWGTKDEGVRKEAGDTGALSGWGWGASDGAEGDRSCGNIHGPCSTSASCHSHGASEEARGTTRWERRTRVTEVEQRDLGPSQFVLLGAIYIAQRAWNTSAWAALAQNVASPGTRQHPAKDTSSTCEMRTAEVHKEHVERRSVSSPASAEQQRAAPRGPISAPHRAAACFAGCEQRIPRGRAQEPEQGPSNISSVVDPQLLTIRSSEPSWARGCICVSVLKSPQSIFLPPICLMAFKILFCLGRCERPVAVNAAVCHPPTFHTRKRSVRNCSHPCVLQRLRSLFAGRASYRFAWNGE